MKGILSVSNESARLQQRRDVGDRVLHYDAPPRTSCTVKQNVFSNDGGILETPSIICLIPGRVLCYLWVRQLHDLLGPPDLKNSVNPVLFWGHSAGKPFHLRKPSEALTQLTACWVNQEDNLEDNISFESLVLKRNKAFLITWGFSFFLQACIHSCAANEPVLPIASNNACQSASICTVRLFTSAPFSATIVFTMASSPFSSCVPRHHVLHSKAASQKWRIMQKKTDLIL